MVANTVGRIHTHLCNAVPLVWGSLRLAPINYDYSVLIGSNWVYQVDIVGLVKNFTPSD